MASDSRIGQWMAGASDWLGEQVWFQQLKGKWDELDAASKSYVKAGAMGGALLLAVAMIISSLWTVHSMKSELAEKQELLSTLQTANEELRQLRETTANLPASGNASGSWQSHFESIATGLGLENGALTVSSEKPGSSSESTKEALYELNLKHVSIKQVVRFAHGLETGGRPVKLRNLMIDTKADPEGYMDATLAVSGFAMVNK